MEANPMGATTVDGAVNRLTALFNPEPQGQPEGNVVEPEAPNDAEVEATEAKESTDQPEAEVERYTVKVGEDELEVTLDEMRKGYMMESDYRKKTSEVAEKRKALEAKEADIDSRLAEAKALVEYEISNLDSPEMLELKETDPDSYLKEFERVQKKVESFNKHKAQRDAELQAKQQELIKKEMESLEAAIPDWLDPEVKTKEATEVLGSLEQQGFTRDELSALTDHRMFVLGRKAMLYDQLMNQDLESKKVKTPPKAQQPGTSTSSDERQSRTTQDLRKKLHKTGKPQDAAKLIRSLMR